MRHDKRFGSVRSLTNVSHGAEADICHRRQKMDRMKKAHALPSHDQADTKGADKATGKKGAKAMEGTEKGPKKRKIDVVVKEEQAADGGDWLV